MWIFHTIFWFGVVNIISSAPSWLIERRSDDPVRVNLLRWRWAVLVCVHDQQHSAADSPLTACGFGFPAADRMLHIRLDLTRLAFCLLLTQMWRQIKASGMHPALVYVSVDGNRRAGEHTDYGLKRVSGSLFPVYISSLTKGTWRFTHVYNICHQSRKTSHQLLLFTLYVYWITRGQTF